MDEYIALSLFWKRVKPTYNPKWSMIELAKGDIRPSLNRTFSLYTQRFLHTIKRCDGVHTVLWVRNEDIDKWRSREGAQYIRHCIESLFCEDDGRRLFPKIYRLADSLKEKRKKISAQKKHRMAAQREK